MTSFRLVNFKAFHDTGWIKVNRLTLLLGENSSGKSALYQALQMVAYSYNRMMQEDRFTNLSRIAEEIGNFEDICNKSAKNPVVEIGFRFLHEEKILEYCVYIGRSENNEFGRVIKVQGRTGNQSWDLLKYYESTNIFFLKRRKLEIPKEIEELAGCVLASLRQFAQSFQVLTAHRYRPERFLQLTGGEYENVGMTGANTYDMLFSLSEIHGKKASLVEEWLSRFGYTYRWKMSGVGRSVSLLLRRYIRGQYGLCAVEIDDNGEFRNTSKQFRQFFSSDFIDIEKMDEIRRKKYADKNCN